MALNRVWGRGRAKLYTSESTGNFPIVWQAKRVTLWINTAYGHAVWIIFRLRAFVSLQAANKGIPLILAIVGSA